MEVILLVIRPKHNVFGQDYRAKLYDILLLDHKNVERHGKSTKCLPSFLPAPEKEPRDEILSNLYSLTGAEHGGIKGERVLYVPWYTDGHRSSLSRFTLYCIPVSARDKLNSAFVDKSPDSPGFYSLDSLLHSLSSSSSNFPPSTKASVLQIESWLREKHSKPGSLELLFRSRADFRVKLIINNPAISFGNRLAAHEYAEQLMTVEKCTKVVNNPLFASGLLATRRRKQTEAYPPPDYIEFDSTSRKESFSSTVDPDTFIYTIEEREQYPVHTLAKTGDVLNIQYLISPPFPFRPALSSRDRYGWMPIHYASWFGNTDIVQFLLREGCSPNVVNSDDRTPLHLSAIKGYPSVVEVLLSRPEMDMNLVDKKGRTAMELCEQKASIEHAQVVMLLEISARQPSKIQVLMMDGTSKSLSLVDGANTSVQQLNLQMLREFNMPEIPYADIFTIWICSQSLELQLNPEHKPLEAMSDWQRKKVNHFIDGDPKHEEPHLKWRRNAKISLIVERGVEHPDAVRLLFHEAKQNYINAFYPCKDPDILLFAAILLYLNHGETDQKLAKAFVDTKRNMHILVPSPYLKSRSNWAHRVFSKYKELLNREVRPLALQMDFLNNCRKLTVYGSVFFTGDLLTGNSRQPSKCYIAVNDVGIHIINYSSRVMLHSYKYSEINWKPNEYGVLELTVVRTDVNVRHAPRNTLKLLTKQAGMINHLMKKLSHITYGIMSSRPLSRN